jgi:hypothetical protein
MSSRKVTVQLGGSGVSFTALLGLLFIGLKLGGVIAWSWFWVLCPFWIGLAVILSIVLVVFIFLVIAAIAHAIFG